jgi:predicted alpha/beta-fold hydrolase
MSKLLPSARQSSLLTDQIRDTDGQTINVYDHFGIRKEGLRTLLGNLEGITCTAQSASRDSHIDTPAPLWDGFEDILVPIGDRFELSGRMGYAERNGEVLKTDCIVILPGLFGDNGVQRTQDMAEYLRAAGFHVLALEVRAHGQTEARHPELYHTWGVLESDDLMYVSDWLEALPEVTRTGLIGYCWGANIAMSAGWYDAVGPQDPLFSDRIRQELTAPVGPRRYRAGIILLSPILGWERLRDELETPRGPLSDPIYHAIQETIQNRMIRKGYEAPSGSLRQLIQEEFDHCDVPLPHGVEEAFVLVRFLPYKNKTFHDKLSKVRTPLLFVHGANDPLSPAQEIADLVATTDNPNVASVILPGGGHVGFAAYAKEYYFGLVAKFFDPVTGPSAFGATASPTMPAVDRSVTPSANHAPAATACRRQ